MKLWFCLTKENKKRLAQVYREVAGKKIIPPGRARGKIRKTKIEDQLLSALLIVIASGTKYPALFT